MTAAAYLSKRTPEMVTLLKWIVVVGVLTLAPMQAWGACAWVLWVEHTVFIRSERPSSGWTLIGAWPAYERCEEGRTAKAMQLGEITDSDRSGPNVARVETKETGNIVTKTTHLKDGGSIVQSYRLTCLPDAIDPRGPKGGNR